MCVSVKGLGPLESCVRLLESRLGLRMCLNLSVHVLSGCLRGSLLPLPELIPRPCLAVLHALSLIHGPWAKICSLSLDWNCHPGEGSDVSGLVLSPRAKW